MVDSHAKVCGYIQEDKHISVLMDEIPGKQLKYRGWQEIIEEQRTRIQPVRRGKEYFIVSDVTIQVYGTSHPES